MRILGLLGTLCVLMNACATRSLAEEGAIPRQVSQWLIVPPPKPNSDAWYAANWSEYSWKVSLEKGEIVATNEGSRDRPTAQLPFPLKDKEMKYGTIRFTKVDDGWLVGRNAGEFGGDLWWYAPEGKQHYKISNEQIIGFSQTAAGLFAYEGLAHMSLSYGHLLRLRKDSSKHWKSSRWIDLKYAPEAYSVETDGSFLVATTSTVIRVKPDKHIDVLAPQIFWKGFFARSLLETPSGEIYLGMRHGIVRMRPGPKGYALEWLLPNRAFVNAKAKLP